MRKRKPTSPGEIPKADVALRLAAALDTTAEFWLNAQKAVDLHKALEKNKKLPGPLRYAA